MRLIAEEIVSGMLLRDIAHSRTGDKGNIVTVSLIAYRPKDFALLEERGTAERVTELFAGMIDRPVTPHVVSHLAARTFVLHRPEAQSVTHSLALDAHVKCLGSALLAIEI